jgi:Uncharacterised nucleotidyltransferase
LEFGIAALHRLTLYLVSTTGDPEEPKIEGLDLARKILVVLKKRMAFLTPWLKFGPDIIIEVFIAAMFSPSLKLQPTITDEEIQLLCYCAHHDLSNAAIERMKALLQQEINWGALIQMAEVHGVLPWLYKSLSVHCIEKVPQDVLNQLRSRFHLNTIHNQCLVKELLRILDLLEANQVPAIPFKGPTLAVLAHNDLALRQFSDLDILVHEQDFLKARDLLLSDGYQKGTDLQGLADIETQDLARMADWGECSLRHSNGLVSIDLHGRLVAGDFPLLSANFDLFWESLSDVSLLRTEVQTFCPENLLLYLCIHGAKDLWKKLSWIGDIAALIHTHPDLNWNQLIKRAQSLESSQMLWLGLSLARDILEAPLPDFVDQHIQTNFKRKPLLAQIKRQVLSGIYPFDIQYSNFQLFYFHHQVIENRGDKWRYYLTFWSRRLSIRIEPNVHDQAFFPLPRRLYALYYFVRPIRILVEFVDDFAKRFQKT